MRKLLTLLVVLGLVACGPGVTKADELSNGNMNMVDPGGTQQLFPTPTDWIVKATRGATDPYNDGLSAEPQFNLPADAPGEHGVLFKGFTGNPPWDPTTGTVTAHLTQDNPGTPGRKYTLTGQFGAEKNYSGIVAPLITKTEFALEFLDAGNAMISGSVLDLNPGLLASQGNGNRFSHDDYMVMATAPAGTTTVRVRASMIDGFFTMDEPVPNGGQALASDNYTLTSIPEPASVMLGLIGVLAMLGLARRR